MIGWIGCRTEPHNNTIFILLVCDQLFKKSAETAPDSGASKWLYLGQLYEGWHALQSFSKGAELLTAELESRKVRIPGS